MAGFATPLPMLSAHSTLTAQCNCTFHSTKRPRVWQPRTKRISPIMMSAGSQEDNSQDSMPQEETDTTNKSRFNRSDDGSRDVEFDVGEEGDGNELFEFVRKVAPPDLVARFSKNAPKVVQNAIRHTLMNMLGSLPPVAFSASVETVAANLVQLLHSSLVTGYMMRNAQYRMSLTRTLAVTERKSLPGTTAIDPEIQGGTALFRNEDGSTTEMPMGDYVKELKDTVARLQSDLERERKGGNELLSYVATMDKKSIEALTKNAGEEVVSAMKSVIRAVTKSQKIPLKPDAVVQASSFELSQLLFYLMVTGYFLREAEVRVELQRNLGGNGPLALDKLLEGDVS